MGVGDVSSAAAARSVVCWERIAAEKASQAWPSWLQQELRSTHAGETGAVFIYKGALAAMQLRSWGALTLRRFAGFESGCPYESLSRQPAYAFAQRHQETEQEHLDAMDMLLAPSERSKLLPLWKAAGMTVGAIPILASPYSAVLFFTTINAVSQSFT